MPIPICQMKMAKLVYKNFHPLNLFPFPLKVKSKGLKKGDFYIYEVARLPMRPLQ